MGWAARLHAERQSANPRGRTGPGDTKWSAFARVWPAFTPNSLVVMADRIYVVAANGSLRRLPIGEAFNVKVVNAEV